MDPVLRLRPPGDPQTAHPRNAHDRGHQVQGAAGQEDRVLGVGRAVRVPGRRVRARREARGRGDHAAPAPDRGGFDKRKLMYKGTIELEEFWSEEVKVRGTFCVMNREKVRWLSLLVVGEGADAGRGAGQSDVVALVCSVKYMLKDVWSNCSD